jgi:Protein of unknown function (DUF3147)
MGIEVNIAALRRTRWNEYAVRFVFGGIVTAMTGLIAKQFGPGVAGLFLAFPAIFPASATLIEKHEMQKKERTGFDGKSRGRSIASVDAAGAAMGSTGLIAFALLVWQFLPGHSAWTVLATAAVVWFAVALATWWLRRVI